MTSIYFLEQEALTRIRESLHRAAQDRLAVLACQAGRHGERRSRGPSLIALIWPPVLKGLCARLASSSRALCPQISKGRR
jgi:hypothetical protein